MALPQSPVTLAGVPSLLCTSNLPICKMGAEMVPTLLEDDLYLLYLFNKHDVPGT